MQTVGASRQRAPLARDSWARAAPTARARRRSKVAAMLQAAGKQAALVLPSMAAPRVPLGPSVVLMAGTLEGTSPVSTKLRPARRRIWR